MIVRDRYLFFFGLVWFGLYYFLACGLVFFLLFFQFQNKEIFVFESKKKEERGFALINAKFFCLFV